MNRQMMTGALVMFLSAMSVNVLAADEAATQPTTQTAAEKWDAKVFDYEHKKIAVEESMPTPQQVALWQRPAPLRDSREIIATSKSAKPRRVENLDIVHLQFKDSQGSVVPALLAKPAGMNGPFP